MKNNLVTEQLNYTGNIRIPTRLSLIVYGINQLETYESHDFDSLKEQLDIKKINWLQIHGMSDTKIIQNICEHFDIDFLVIQDILNANHPTKIEEHDTYTLIILKIFDYLGTEELGSQQLAIIQGNNFVISFLENEVDFFANVKQAIDNNIIKIRNRQSDYLLSVLLNNVMSNYTNTIMKIDEALEDLEEELLNISKDRDIGIQIQLRRRQYMEMKRAIYPLKEQYIKLLRMDNKLVHKVTRPYFNDVNDHLQFVLQTIDICRETLSSLVDLYISNNDLRMNDIMKRLTVVSTIFIPLTFLAGIWGMNFEFMPELNWKYGYMVAWGLMIIIGFTIYLFFRKKKWN